LSKQLCTPKRVKNKFSTEELINIGSRKKNNERILVAVNNLLLALLIMLTSSFYRIEQS
jgi:hypothetical protein